METDSDRRMRLLIERLPTWMQSAVRWIRDPKARWIRIPVGVLLILGSFLAILPLFGIWMLPLGMILLAQDIPLFKRWVDGLLAWIERRHPKWLGIQ